MASSSPANREQSHGHSVVDYSIREPVRCFGKASYIDRDGATLYDLTLFLVLAKLQVTGLRVEVVVTRDTPAVQCVACASL